MFPGGIGIQEVIIVGAIAVLLFGGRLPDVARTVGQSYQQFRKGISDLQASIKLEEPSESPRIPDYSDSNEDYEEEPESPRFEPPSD